LVVSGVDLHIKTYKAKDWREETSICKSTGQHPSQLPRFYVKEQKLTMLEPIIYCARMMNAHTESVAVFPKLFKKI
jgi:hypothetical protein